jgi:gas vesicle protein
MNRIACAALLAGILATGCTRDDRDGTRQKTKEAGRELRHEADQAKQKLKEGWRETKKEVKDDVKKLNEHDRH